MKSINILRARASSSNISYIRNKINYDCNAWYCYNFGIDNIYFIVDNIWVIISEDIRAIIGRK